MPPVSTDETIMNLFSNLEFFVHLARHDSIASAANEMDITPSAASKKLKALEDFYHVALIKRGANQFTLTEEGEELLAGSNDLLAQSHKLRQRLAADNALPSGTIVVSAPFGIGRFYIAPLIADFSKQFPSIKIKLFLTDKHIKASNESVDVAIHVGTPPESRVVAKHLAKNPYALCASPSYLEAYGIPAAPSDLKAHQIIGLRQYEESANFWHFKKDGDSIGVRVPLSYETNDGEIALEWALAGLGVIRRANWHVFPYLESGALVTLLDDYECSATEIYALFSPNARKTKRVSLFLDFIESKLQF